MTVILIRVSVMMTLFTFCLLNCVYVITMTVGEAFSLSKSSQHSAKIFQLESV